MPEDVQRTRKEWAEYFGFGPRNSTDATTESLHEYITLGLVPKQYLHSWDLEMFSCLQTTQDRASISRFAITERDELDDLMNRNSLSLVL